MKSSEPGIADSFSKAAANQPFSKQCISLSSSAIGLVQPRLSINQPNDAYEQEADAVADKVMQMTSPDVQVMPLSISGVQRKCAHCKAEEKLQRKELNGDEPMVDEGFENYVNGLSSSGESLPGDIRSFYEPRFGYDFGNVKVHTDTVATKSAQSINALAYTNSNNIVFNEGQYSPNSDSGKRLLAHELTHVIQQRTADNSISRFIQRECPDDGTPCFEEESQSGASGYVPDSGSGGGGGYVPDSGSGGGGGYVPDSGSGGGEGYIPDSGSGGGGGYVPDFGSGGAGRYVPDSGNGGYIPDSDNGGGGGRTSNPINEGNEVNEGYAPNSNTQEPNPSVLTDIPEYKGDVCKRDCLGPKQDAIDAAAEGLKSAQDNYDNASSLFKVSCGIAASGAAAATVAGAYNGAEIGGTIGFLGGQPLAGGIIGGIGGGAIGAVKGSAAAVPVCLAGHYNKLKAQNDLQRAKNDYDRTVNALHRDCCKPAP